MSLKVLPNDVRSILCASAQINNYKTAVEELVYNALDAESTSIAIRVHIENNNIQVIDNGYGITRNDFDALGQRYMTSKLTDLSTLKSVPTCYGYRGEFLANIIEISYNVKIISRHKNGEETWAKTFHKGKKKQLTKMTTRPSKGTTIEIQGFLYNLKIKKRAIDPVNDLQNIKSCLEQLSIVHNNISLSLRDDAKNEIIFKIHKKRDIHQTLSTLFNIEKTMVQELQVEKNKYKVKALIGETDLNIGRQWVYLNRKFVQSSSKLHKIINEYFKKYLLMKDKKKTKSKNNHDEDHLFNQNVPFYFVFITCPYIDYDTNPTLGYSVVEFKNWEQMKNMLEKLVKFYFGEICLKDCNKAENKVTLQKQANDEGNNNTRDQIKKIIDKILGTNSKRLGVSQLQNGVKGKLAKRKKKKKAIDANTPNLFPKSDRQSNIYNQDMVADVSLQDFNLNNKHDENVRKAGNLSVGIGNLATQKQTNSSSIDNIQKAKDIPEKNDENKIVTPHFDQSSITIKSSKNKRSKKKNGKKKKNKSSDNMVHKIIKTNEHRIKTKKNGNLKHKQRFNDFQFQNVTETDSISKTSKIVAHQVEEYLKHQKNYHLVMNTANTKNMFAKKTCDGDNMIDKSRIFPNLNKCTIDNYIMDKMKTKPFKTTYDLVQTILKSQRENRFDHVKLNSSLENRFKDYPVLINCKQKSIANNMDKMQIKPRFPHDYFSEYMNTNFVCREKQKSKYNIMSRELVSCELSCENTNCTNKCSDIDSRYEGTLDYSIPIAPTQQSLRCEDIFQENSEMLSIQDELPNRSSSMPTLSMLTYESHQYKQTIFDNTNKLHINKGRYVTKTQNVRFITKQSRDNFITTNDKYKSSCKNHLKYRTRGQSNKRNIFNRPHIEQIEDKSYTIEFTKSNEINCSIQESNQSDYKLHSPDYEPTSCFGNTYTIPTFTISSDYKRNDARKHGIHTDSNELFASNSIHDSNTEQKIYNVANTINEKGSHEDILFVSEPCSPNCEVFFGDNIEPINVCETVLGTEDGTEKEFAYNFDEDDRLDNSLHNNVGGMNNNNTGNNEKYYTQILRCQNSNEVVSHHFSNTLNTEHLNVIDNIEANLQLSSVEMNINENENVNECKSKDLEEHNAYLENIEPSLHNIKDNNFDFKDRLRFLPKGMSQIFERCGSKSVCDYNLEKDYYEDMIYNDFATDVQMQTEIYEKAIPNVEELTTKDIHKIKNKLLKDSTFLAFDEISLNEVKVLNQVDCKFIAAIMKEKYSESKTATKYLVLFDQHAVHERIRLEQNLAGYFNEDKWKSVPLDNITLKMTNDEILYLHNFKDKFNQLGLQWTILDVNEVLVSSIPEAILGKNPREVDKVMKAVKNLIVEEINVIKLQKGCISLYPKSIMDLVFSEACRYAIKFGDKLSKNNCVDLLNDLSNCKTPFQCAHGRPVMAVLVDIKNQTRDYKLDMEKLIRFKLNKQRINA